MLRFNIIKFAAVAALFMVLILCLYCRNGSNCYAFGSHGFYFSDRFDFRKQKDLYSTLALAGLIILAISPEALF